MKNNKLYLMAALALTFTFVGCEDDPVLTPNPTYTDGGGTGGGGNGSGGGTGGGGGNAGFLASTDSTGRVAVLEDFTGVRCGFCPDGHDVAKTIEQQLGDKFIVIAVHGGSYAQPSPGWMDFTTPFAQGLIDQAQVSGYPAGQLNRKLASDLGVSPQRNGMAMGRGSWKSAAEAVIQLPAPVNIGAKATWNSDSTEISIKVDAYYTAEETMANNINIALLQSGISSRQSGGSPEQGYIQNHVLRDLITGQWGAPITSATDKDAKVSETFSYTLPADYNGSGPDGGGPIVQSDMDIVVFITRGNSDILNAIEIDIE
tara:strand:- start:1885 stop:2829 length:945 start_codon:yes stop_codon:yes gene_type:complete